jgi:hypothetical protein
MKRNEKAASVDFNRRVKVPISRTSKGNFWWSENAGEAYFYIIGKKEDVDK